MTPEQGDDAHILSGDPPFNHLQSGRTGPGSYLCVAQRDSR